ncbi:MAG: hypothetical protein Q7U05_01095 [Polaromonas sp.]|nr:hypothetical protein [Polaromonas sp.]
MKYTTEQLLLAVQVRGLAFAFRNNDTPEQLEGLELIEWRKANPLNTWITLAMKELESVADSITNYQS